MKYHHEYDVTLQLDTLSINVPFKARVGANRKWDFSKAGYPTKVGGVVKEGTNVTRGLNGDFELRCSYLWQKEGILFGRNYMTAPPVKSNPQMIIFAVKHLIVTVETLMKWGILTK
jgi:hypothetical protein